MNVIAERRRVGAVCPRCRSSGYDTTPPVEGDSDRPSFKCTTCGHYWTYGKTGGIYMELSKVLK